MSMPYPPQQPQGGYPAQPQNGLGTAGFVVGLIGLVFSIIPFVGIIAWPLVIIGAVLSGVGMSKAMSGVANNKGLAIAGLVCSIVGLVCCFVYLSAWNDVVENGNEILRNLPNQ
ncbi:hypothetical protein NLX83_07710 [Allokutzneria sp. A3M-2-11 16]|uniref:hypothetical protein n=1 Tax=Allokutzneria sp. A3M-2-11 16 TaxID=2962043 RepID=UPI0020B7242C|nr:hypothetical protein [Allokutzneria sp. A3M-2-11 16]MCP3799138.1 hypothetical protein [Allokutzneria sp. A3M-2-11 16]